MSVANFLMGRSVLVEAKMNKESKLLNACTRLDNIVGVLNSESTVVPYRVKYQYGRRNMKLRRK